jgi:hypothetical protein
MLPMIPITTVTYRFAPLRNICMAKTTLCDTIQRIPPIEMERMTVGDEEIYAWFAQLTDSRTVVGSCSPALVSLKKCMDDPSAQKPRTNYDVSHYNPPVSGFPARPSKCYYYYSRVHSSRAMRRSAGAPNEKFLWRRIIDLESECMGTCPPTHEPRIGIGSQDTRWSPRLPFPVE